MKISQKKMVSVDVKTVQIHCKVTDRFTYALLDASGETVLDYGDGYVPEFMPGQHHGGYIILDIDVDTGMIINWIPPTAAQLEAVINAVERA